MKKESIFTKEGVFSCDVYNLQFWKLRRSTLLQKVFFYGSGDTVAFSRRSLIFQRQEKAGGSFFVDIQKRSWRFFTAARKNRSIFLLSSKADRRFQNGREKHHYEFFFQMCRSCSPSSLIRHSQSPDDFSQLSSLKTLLSRTEAASRILVLGKDQGTVTVTKF